RSHGPVVFYCWERDTLQHVPRRWWGSTVWDLVDSPVLATERRIAGDETLGGWEKFLLQLSLGQLRRFERKGIQRVGRGVLTPPADIAIVRQRVPGVEVANVIDGADADYFSPAAVPGEKEAPYDLLFFGSLAFPPNADAALHL